MITKTSIVLAAALLSAVATSVNGQQNNDVSHMSLQELLEVEVVSAASKFPQEVSRAPSSITIITAEDIRRFGYRTLADVLRSVRGLYVTDDRNYTYLGVRGFSRPGDYNSRVLLLIDGHRLNDPIYEQGPIGTDFPIDVEAIDRVEIIRGPGSSLYGTNALLGVINVVTRTGDQEAGVRVDAVGASLETFSGRVSMGRLFGGATEALVSASLSNSGGITAMYFPEFDSPETGNGIVRNRDGDLDARLAGTLSVGRVTLRGVYGDRWKDVPTASFGSVFGGRERTRDARWFGEVSYSGRFGRGWSGTLRGTYDAYHYTGRYPFAADDGDVFQDYAITDWLGTDLTANRRVHDKHLLTVGTEGRFVLRQDQYSRQFGELTIQDRRHSGTWGIYVQDEFAATPSVILTGGVRLDHYGTFGQQVTPRAALIYHPARATSLKLLHGRAFRAPNAYELYYYTNALQNASTVQPETTTTNEAVWEQTYGRTVRSSVSVFHSDIRNLISEAGGDDFLNESYFWNASSARSAGFETEVEARLKSGVMTRVSYARADASDRETHTVLSNSPRHLTKYVFGVPLRTMPWFVSAEGAYVSERLSARGEHVPGFYLQHITATTSGLLKRADATFGVYNLFDRRYADPGSEEHTQAQIPQEGRTVRAKITVRF